MFHQRHDLVHPRYPLRVGRDPPTLVAGNQDFYLFDGLGSVSAVTDPSGTVANSYSYDPYGNVVNSRLTVSNPFEYASGWTSGVTDFTHLGARWYASTPQYGRWTQQDSVASSLFQPMAQCRYDYVHERERERETVCT